MADLKNFDEKTLLDTLTWAAQHAQDAVKATAQAVLDDICEVAKAQSLLPKRLDDLLTNSVGFWVKEFIPHEFNPDHPLELRDIKVHIADRAVLMTSSNDPRDIRPRELPNKRYRVIVILQEVDS